jgi:hypothetical protein
MSRGFRIDSNGGYIGPFWWVNGDMRSLKMRGLYGLVGDPSIHHVWRQGASGWGDPTGKRILWRFIK